MNQKHANSTIETYKHTNTVRDNLNIFIKELIDRGQNHDWSKFESPQVEIFGEYTEELGKTIYGSPEYKECLERVKPAIDDHYAKERHHSEHFPNGINDMNLVDVLEMIADWAAATKRNKAGNLRKSIEINTQRYNISPQLRQILENTVKDFLD